MSSIALLPFMSFIALLLHACRANPEAYTSLIKAQNADGLMDLLTDLKVEQNVVDRVRLKAATFGQDIGGIGSQQQNQQDAVNLKVRPDIMAKMYEKMIMPLTKDVQVEYLLHRLDHE
jgi:chorismate mutase